MTLKKYKQIKLAIVVIISMIFSQSIIYKNYLIPIVTLIISWLVLIRLRRQIKGILADERDYAIGGKSALMSIQIYSWISVAAMFILYAARDINPSYEVIAVTLAYSTCILMFLYSLVFHFYNKVKFADKKNDY